MEACICLTRKIHPHLIALLEEFFVFIYTRRQGHFPMLHDNLLSHHTDLAFPLRRQRQLSSRSPPHKHHTVTTSSTTNTNGTPRHSSLLWSITAHHCLQKVFSATCCGHMDSWATGLLSPLVWLPGAPAYHMQCVIACTNRHRWQREGHPTGLLLPTAACSYAGYWATKYDFGINFTSQRSRSYVVPFLKRIVRHSYTFPAMPSCPLPAPSLMQFQANINQFRELHWAKKITTFYRVIILLVLTLQAGMLMDNISAMPREKDHPLPSTSNHLEQTIKP